MTTSNQKTRRLYFKAHILVTHIINYAISTYIFVITSSENVLSFKAVTSFKIKDYTP